MKNIKRIFLAILLAASCTLAQGTKIEKDKTIISNDFEVVGNTVLGGTFSAENDATYMDTVSKASTALQSESLWVAESNKVVRTNSAEYTGTVAKANLAYPASNPSNFISSDLGGNTISNASFSGDGAAISNVDAALLSGYTIEDVMRVGSTYYFNTNVVVIGVVTGRLTSLALPQEAQEATYAGPFTNGQYLSTYIIKEDEMPNLLQMGLYSFNFFGYKTVNNKNPKIGADIYVINKTNGVVAYEFESDSEHPTAVPDDDDASYGFVINVLVTNDVSKNGYVFVLKTKVIDADGYAGDFTSFNGMGYYAGFTMPINSGVYVSYADWNSDKTNRANLGYTNVFLAPQKTTRTSGFSSDELIPQKAVQDIYDITKDPSGFSGDTDNIGIFAFDSTTRVFSLTNSSAMPVYNRGVLFTNSTAYVFPATGTNRGTWYFKWAQSNGAMSVTQDGWSLDDIQVATVYRGTNGNDLVFEETHGLMPWPVHQRFHLDRKLSAAYISGLDLTATNPAGFSLSSGAWMDEDIVHHVLSPITNGLVFFRDGSTGYMNFLGPRSIWVVTNPANGIYRYDNGGVLTDIPAENTENYFSMWCYITPCEQSEVFWVVGQSVGTLANIAAELPPDLSAIAPSAEMLLLYKVILHGTNGVFVQKSDYRPTGPSGTPTALISSVRPSFIMALSTNTIYTNAATTTNSPPFERMVYQSGTTYNTNTSIWTPPYGECEIGASLRARTASNAGGKQFVRMFLFKNEEKWIDLWDYVTIEAETPLMNPVYYFLNDASTNQYQLKIAIEWNNCTFYGPQNDRWWGRFIGQ